MLIAAGAKVDYQNEFATALFDACTAMDPNYEIFESLLHAGADVNVQKEGQTVLHALIRQLQVQYKISTFYSAGSVASLQAKSRYTEAIEIYEKIIELVLSRTNILLKAKDKEGKTAFDLVKQRLTRDDLDEKRKDALKKIKNLIEARWERQKELKNPFETTRFQIN